MKSRIAFFVSLLLVLVALCLGAAAKGQLELGYRMMRELGLKKFPEAQSDRGALLLYTSFTLAAASLVCLVISYRKREPAWRWIVVVLLGLFLLISIAPA
jgi:hypothetical protein